MTQAIRHITYFREMMILAGCFFIVAVFELFAHWYMSKGYPLSGHFLHWYLYRYPDTSKCYFYVLDILLPTFALGLSLGWIGWRWTFWQLTSFVVLAAMEIVALGLVCPLFLPSKLVWWYPSTTGDFIFFIFRQGLFGIIGVAVLLQFGRRFHGDRSHSIEHHANVA